LPPVRFRLATFWNMASGTVVSLSFRFIIHLCIAAPIVGNDGGRY
jgi:hypothetical protein